ncbi:MAG TPA: PEGA domain-containing protein [Vicinamibacterales bacterium]|jgi:hypothetical protein
MRRNIQIALLAPLVLAVLAFLPATAEAQRHGGGHGHGGGGARVVIGGYWGWGSYWNPYWDPYFYGPYYWNRYPGVGYYDDGYEDTARLRLQVKPSEAQVYVDGYFTGTVDDFDGVFKRLRVRPGEHELVFYLKGYHTVRQTVRLRAGDDSRIRYTLEPLAAGDANEPPPQPPAKVASEQPDTDAPSAPTPRRGLRPRQPREIREPGEAGAAEARGFGTLLIRVQPAAAEVYVDGNRWQGPDGAERLVIQVSEGPHKVEIRKDGFTPFTTEITVRSGETAPLNVSLSPHGA